jgi:hypothetical protein
MLMDQYGTRLGTSSPQAAAAVTKATRLVLAHRPGVDAALADALAADPGSVGAHALRGLCQVLLARADTIALARKHLRDAAAAQARGGASADEIALVQALRLGVHGGLRGAAEICEAHLGSEPHAVLFAKLAHALRFMAGDTAALSLAVDRAIAASVPSAPGFGFLLGCRAFAMEEQGAFTAAERLGRHALDIEPEDAWAIHAVGHVHEMKGRAQDGLNWIATQRPVWSRCNNFAQHMSWHAALFHLERGDGDAALGLYDSEVWPRASDDFRDVSNAVGLLHRLESFGVDVGTRWHALAEIAARQRGDVTLTFAGLHHLLALLATRRMNDAMDLLEAFERPALPGNDQERVLRQVGRGLARVLVEAAQGGPRHHDLAGLLAHLPGIGGSFAQRDLFLRALVDLTADRADETGLAQVLAARHQLKCSDRFSAMIAARIETRARMTRRIA